MIRRLARLVWLAALVAMPVGALVPRDAARVDVDATRVAALPLHAYFADEHGRAVTLGDYVRERPAILVFGYYGCSSLCSVVLEGLRVSLDRARLVAGRDTEIVVVSIAPLETPADARRRRMQVVGNDDRADAAGWHFLTGAEDAIAPLVAAAGYTYAYDEATAQFAHPAGVMIVGDDGHVRARLPGVAFAPAALRAGLDAAGSATPAAKSGRWLLCFHDDWVTGRYNATSMTAVRIAALAVLVALGGYVARARWREARPHAAGRPGGRG
jgi:protein SCO1/2